MTRSYSLLPLFVFFLMVVGCGKTNTTPGSVTGKVTYKGAPVTAGNMTFYLSSGGSYVGTLDNAGNYEVSLPAGEVTVTIETESFNKKSAQVYGGGKGGSKGMTSSPKPPGAGGEPEPGAYVQIPKKYAEKDKTDLKFTVSNGKQVKDWDLKD